MAKVSVLISVYNGEAYLREAMQSVFDQTERDIELVVINDGSTDGTDAVIRSFTDPRLRYVDLPHRGRVPALNEGLKHCVGEYIAILDADDACLPDRIETQVRCMIEKNLGLCGSWAEVINESGEIVGIMDYPPVNAEHIRSMSLLHNPLIHSTVMVRKSVLDAVGYYRSRHSHGVEDYELWTRIIYSYDVANIARPLVQYRVHTNQSSKKVTIKTRFNLVRVRLLAMWRFLVRR